MAHRTDAEMTGLLAAIAGSPADHGVLRGITVRPDHGLRETPGSVAISLAGGVAGDHWAKGCWKSLPDGTPHPDVQICIMNARAIAFIAGSEDPADWAPAGDNLFVDLDIGPENLPAGQRLAIGSAEIEITAEPHLGCRHFSARFGRPALRFVNSPQGRAMRLRGVYARVVRDGTVSVGDRITKT
ncbi:MAG: MOSC domain-containing protein [Alphaproteobacteria bacterium]|nr:MAG: MOSC domain-containing protein [Alphaproteobacteria bacterium]